MQILGFGRVGGLGVGGDTIAGGGVGVRGPGYIYTLWLFNIAMENGPFIDGLAIQNGGSVHGYVK